jgi:hypothetical protein
LIRKFFLVLMVAYILMVYAYPALRTSVATGSRQLPPLHAPDLSLYLNISRLTSPSPGLIVNPYYGIDVPSDASGHLQFRVAFQLFGKLLSLLRGNLCLSVFVWNLFWWGLLCGVALVLFELFLPDSSPAVVTLGLSLLMLFNFGNIPSDLEAWLHPSWLRFEDLQLPYIRSFFPQIPVPLVLAYLAILIRWSQQKRWTLLVALGFLQWIGFGVFPYATLMMAGITAIVAAREIAVHRRWTILLSLLSYAIACAGIDLLFLSFSHHTGTASNTANHVSLIRFDVTALHHIVGGMWFLLIVLTIMMLAARKLSPEVRWALVGLGLSCTAMMSGDLFLPEGMLMVSHHGAYFAHATVAVLATFLISVTVHQKDKWRALTQPALWSIIFLLAVNGMFVAEATFRRFLPYNREVADLAAVLKVTSAGDNDLVVAPAETVEDACAWAPVLSRSNVLYCRNAGTMLTAEQYESVHRFRQAFYLYFTGADDQQLIAAMHSPDLNAKQLRLAFGGLSPSSDEEKRKGLEEAQSILVPFVEELEHHDLSMTRFIRQYGRVLVVDSNSHPIFDRHNLSSYLTIQKETVVGSLKVAVCSPK